MYYSFLHVNYNNSQLTINCIESVFAMKSDVENDRIRIIIIDNASRTEEKSILENWKTDHPEYAVEFLFLENNVGYFRAFNQGLAALKPEKMSTVIIGNNDLRFDPMFLDRLKNYKYEKNVFCIAPNIINKDGLHQNPHLIKKFSLLRIVYYNLYFIHYYFAVLLNNLSGILKIRASRKDKGGYMESQYITMGFGACYVLTPFFFQKFKKLDDYTFLMGEEGVLTNQILKGEGRTFYNKDLIVYHDDSATFKSIPSKTTYNFSRDAFFNSRRHYKLRELNDKRI